MKKFLLFISVVSLLIAGGVYFGGGIVVEKYSRKFLPRVSEVVAGSGVQIDALSFKSAKVTGPTTATWYGIAGTVKVKADGMINRAREFDVEIDSLSISPQDMMLKTALLDLRGISLKTRGQALLADVAGAGEIKGEHISGDILQVILPISVPDASPTIKFVKHTIQNLLKSGTIDTEFEFEGRIDISAVNQEGKGSAVEMVPVRLRTLVQGRSRSIVLDRHDLAAFAERFEDQLTDGEITFVAQHPLQAPLLMGIRHRAEVAAKQALTSGLVTKGAQPKAESGEGDDERTVTERKGPYDAYRYVLWSYLLAKQLGPEFAKAVTDAHEDRADQPDEERKMDLNNANVGRAYAKRGVAEGEILKLVLSDPAVIRDPS